ncbi:hypothetical protein AMECASPLE_039593 [Ameca splendens]|uniref:Uncharacterized protein n=1 Tax=Ameca splendens TaxID=208324 RepID=A0ABV0ZU60_9TELE
MKGGLMAALSENVVTVNMLLSVFFLPGALANCGHTKPALSITTRKPIEALSGSCLQIPCTYNTTDKTFDSSRPINGLWMKVIQTDTSSELRTSLLKQQLVLILFR